MTARCPICGNDEARDRCCWPMPDSPLEFFGPSTWLDDDAIDLEIIAQRLGGGGFYRSDVADAIGVTVSCISMYVQRGVLPEPAHYEKAERNRDRPVWTAEQVAGVLIARGA